MSSDMPKLHTEFTVVLPQRVHARVVKVLPWKGQAVLILIRDFAPTEKSTSNSALGGLEPMWRLYQYEPPAGSALEVCVFTQPPERALSGVFMACEDSTVFLLFQDQLLRVDVEGRAVEGICRLQLPRQGDEPPEVRVAEHQRDL